MENFFNFPTYVAVSLLLFVPRNGFPEREPRVVDDLVNDVG